MKLSLRVLFLALAVLAAGCVTSHTLESGLSSYRTNIIITEDNKLKIENDYINFANFRLELIRRMIADKTPILIHAHKNCSPKAFDAVLNKLREHGYNNIEFRVFGE